MPDYSKGKIYKLHILNNDELIYYGSTIQTLSLRMSGHRADFKRNKNGKGKYTTSFKLFDTDYKNVVITLIEKFPCNCKNELLSQERFYIENNKCVNKSIPTRTFKEWKEDNKDKIKENNKKYRNENKEKIKEYIKEYMKEYRKKNIEKNKEYIKEYNNNNKEKIECQYCKSIIKKFGLKRHQKTIKCKAFQSNI